MNTRELKREAKRRTAADIDTLRDSHKGAKRDLRLAKRDYRNGKKLYKSEKRRLKRNMHLEIDEIKASCSRPHIDPPKRGLLEEIGNATTHGVGAALAIVALVLMCLSANTPRQYVGAALYSFGLFAMFTMSCLYHSFRHGSAVKRLFRRFDYSGIYLVIGATFAPILLAYVENSTLGLVFLIVQWAVIATGITLVGVFGPARLRFIHMPLYMVLGWCALFFIPEMIRRGDWYLFGFILGGGVVYSLGMIPFALKKRVAHFVWHFFVLAGAVVQWIGIYITIYPG